MAHEIDMTGGIARVMVAGAPAWHRLGVNVAEAQTSDEAIKLAGLDWNVEQVPVQAVRTVEVDGQLVTRTIDIPGKYANIRSDSEAPLAVVSDSYRVFQNREAFDFMDSIVGEKLAMYETAGSLKGGKQVWMMARVPGELRATDNDVTLPYILLSNTHDGSQALRMVPTAVRVVCANTLTLALSRSHRTQGVTIRHCESLKERVEEARKAFSIVTKRLQAHGEEMQQMAERKMTSDELAAYFTRIVTTQAPSDTKRKELLNSLATALHHPTNNVDGIGGSVWAAYNAVSYYADHMTKVRGSGLKADDARLNSVWFGSANELKQLAYNAALDLLSV